MTEQQIRETAETPAPPASKVCVVMQAEPLRPREWRFVLGCGEWRNRPALADVALALYDRGFVIGDACVWHGEPVIYVTSPPTGRTPEHVAEEIRRIAAEVAPLGFTPIASSEVVAVGERAC